MVGNLPGILVEGPPTENMVNLDLVSAPSDLGHVLLGHRVRHRGLNDRALLDCDRVASLDGEGAQVVVSDVSAY